MGNLFSCGADQRLNESPASQEEPQTVLLNNPIVKIALDRVEFKNNLGAVYNGTVGFNPATFVKTNKKASYLRLSHANVAKLFFVMMIDGRWHFVFEHLPAPLSEVVRDFSFNNDYKEILSQLADVVEYLHRKGVAGFALEPENLCVVKKDQKYVVKLFDFSDAFFGASDPSDCSQSKFHDISELGTLFLNIFSKGYASKELVIHSIDRILHTKQTASPTYEDYLCADLIHNMKLHQPSERLTAEEVRSHPFFWYEREMVRFILEVSKLIEKEKKEKGENSFTNRLNSISRTTLGENNWVASIEPNVVSELEDARKDFHDRNGGTAQNLGGNIVHLLMAMRNTAVHYQHSEVIAGLMGTDELFINFWLGKFPRLFREVYKAKIDFDEGKPILRTAKTPKIDKRPRRRNKQKS